MNPSSRPIMLVVVEVAAVGEEPLALLEAEVVLAPLAVDQAHPLAGAQRSAVHAGPGLGGDIAGIAGIGLAHGPRA